jgi:tetratricopeptide (TPR) repeat protein
MTARLLALLLLSALLARAQEEERDLFDPARIQNIFGSKSSRTPALDPKRIINESNSFLREREPEMTAEEYALYEKVLSMLATNPPFALRLLEAMIKEDEKPSPAFEFILGNAYYAAGDPVKAEASYKSAVDRYPTFLRAWNNLGVLYYSTDRWGEAVKAFSKSVSLGDREPATYGLLGYSLEKEANYIAAEVAYMQALSGDPTGADWQEGLLRICLQGRQFVRAEAMARTLIKTKPREPRYWLILANILLSDNRKLDAAAVLETCVGAGVAGSEEMMLLGDLYAEQGLHPEALAIYTRLLKPSPETGEERLLRFAQSLATAGRATEARAALAALPAQPRPRVRTEKLMIQAQLSAAAKRWAEARRDLDAILADQPLHGPALLALGKAYAAEGDDARAGFAFESAAQVAATAYRANLELANLALRLRDYPRSVAHLEKALQIERSDAVAEYLARVRGLIASESPAPSS